MPEVRPNVLFFHVDNLGFGELTAIAGAVPGLLHRPDRHFRQGGSVWPTTARNLSAPHPVGSVDRPYSIRSGPHSVPIRQTGVGDSAWRTSATRCLWSAMAARPAAMACRRRPRAVAHDRAFQSGTARRGPRWCWGHRMARSYFKEQQVPNRRGRPPLCHLKKWAVGRRAAPLEGDVDLPVGEGDQAGDGEELSVGKS